MRKALLKTGYRCNNNCVFCHSFYLRSIPQLTTAQVFDRIDMCRDAGFEMVVLSGGEPMIRSDLLDVAGRVNRRGMKLGLITNGRMLFYRDMLEKLAAMGLSYIYISLQGGEKSTHNFLTGSDSFRQTVSGIINTARMGLHPTVNTVVNRRNIGELKTIVDLLAGIGQVRIKFSMIEPRGLAKENFAQVVPPLKETARAISEAISFGLDHYADRDVDFAFDAVPFCLIPEYLHLYDDLFTNKIYAMNEADEKELVTIDYANHSHPKRCLGCSLQGLCKGPFKEYVARSGDSELAPVTEPRSNQFLMRPTGASVRPPKKGCPQAVKRECDELSILVDAGKKGARVYRADTADFSALQVMRTIRTGQVQRLKRNRPINLRAIRVCKKCGACNGIFKEAAFTDPNMKAVASAVSSLRGRVLDVGCGQVEFWKKLAPMISSGRIEYHALDPDPDRIDSIVRRSHKVIAHTTRIEDFIPMPESFDACMMLGSLNHLTDVREGLSRVREGLKTGGMLVAADDVPTALAVDETPPAGGVHEHFRNLDCASAAELAEDAGFAIEKAMDAGPATLNRWAVFARKKV
jgi:MoaA/NifB/PqqE/SkfB family radical SAM enzyme/SAM-dependent methyltransferase